MTRPVVVLGGPGGGTLVAESIRDVAAAGGPVELLGFLNDRVPVGTLFAGAPVLGPFEAWRDQPGNALFVAPLHKAGHMKGQAERIVGLGLPPERWATIVDPRAAVASDATLSAGDCLGPFASVGPGARLGAHVAVRAGAHVSHDVAVGDLVYVGPNAVLCGYVQVDEGAHVAPGALVREERRIGRFAVVGLGAVVVEDVPDYAVVAGNPARRVGSIEAGSARGTDRG